MTRSGRSPYRTANRRLSAAAAQRILRSIVYPESSGFEAPAALESLPKEVVEHRGEQVAPAGPRRTYRPRVPPPGD